MALTKQIICKCGCGRKKDVRVADINRGWGMFFSKSCKARHQGRRHPEEKPDPKARQV